MTNNYQRGQKDTRPWGTWEVTDCGGNFCVKRITVQPNGILSLQSHQFRSEYWVIVSGTAIVTLDDKKFVKKAGESVYISATTKHRIQNTTNEPVAFIEVQTGENLDEDDITRYEDVYGRVPS